MATSTVISKNEWCRSTASPNVVRGRLALLLPPASSSLATAKARRARASGKTAKCQNRYGRRGDRQEGDDPRAFAGGTIDPEDRGQVRRVARAVASGGAGHRCDRRRRRPRGRRGRPASTTRWRSLRLRQSCHSWRATIKALTELESAEAVSRRRGKTVYAGAPASRGGA